MPVEVLAQFDDPYDFAYSDFSDYVYDASYTNASYDSFYGDISYDFAYSDFTDYVYDASYTNAAYDSFYPDSSYPDATYDASYPDASYPDSSYPDATYDASYPDATYPDASYPDALYPDTIYADSPYPDSGYTQGDIPNVIQVDPNTFVSNFNAPNSAAVATQVLGSGGTAAQATQAVLDFLASNGLSGNVTSSTDPTGEWVSIVILCDNATGGIIINVHNPTLPDSAYPDAAYLDSAYPDSAYLDSAYPDSAYLDSSYSDVSDYGVYDSDYTLPVISDLYIVPKLGVNQQLFSANENTTYTYSVGNIGTSSVTAQVGFWPKGAQGVNNMPTCGDPVNPLPGNPVQTQTVSLLPSQIRDVTFDFNVGISSSTAYAYVTYACNGPDDNWSNNSAGISYVINTADWFETFGGDVGAENEISVSGTPPVGRYISKYLLAGNPIGSNANTEKWRLNNYNQPQVSTSVFDYLNDRFRTKANKNACSTNGAFTGISTFPDLNYCIGDVDLNAVTNVPANSIYIWFVDGNLTIEQNLTIPNTSVVVFVVKGSITINSSVSRTDGIYVSRTTFKDVSVSAFGPQLNVGGAIYASDVQLARSCDATCSNITDPVEIITFQPRYIEALNDIIGSPAITWQEVAP